MKLKLILLVLGLAGVTALAVRASSQGWGIAKPAAMAPSIREGSLRESAGRGHRGTRFFVGGGIHGGK